MKPTAVHLPLNRATQLFAALAVVCGTWLAKGPKSNGRPVYKEKAFFLLTILQPGNGLSTAKNSDRAAIYSLI